jgi:hypothetical protein
LPIPALLPSGYLPEGIYECDLEEIELTLTYNEKRQAIWRGFEVILQRLLAIPEIDIVYIDGSFVSDASEPRDIDIAVEFFNVKAYYDVLDKHQDVFWKRDEIKAKYLVDLWWGFLHCTKDMRDADPIELYSRIREHEARKRNLSLRARKGFLKVSLRNDRLRTTSE